MVVCYRFLVVVFLLATLTSTLCCYPHQLAYFNEFAGGPLNGHKHLLHSNLDLGQDLLLVKEWMDQAHVLNSDVGGIPSYYFPSLIQVVSLSEQKHPFCSWNVRPANLEFAKSSLLENLDSAPGDFRLGMTMWVHVRSEK